MVHGSERLTTAGLAGEARKGGAAFTGEEGPSQAQRREGAPLLELRVLAPRKSAGESDVQPQTRH